MNRAGSGFSLIEIIALLIIVCVLIITFLPLYNMGGRSNDGDGFMNSGQPVPADPNSRGKIIRHERRSNSG